MLRQYNKGGRKEKYLDYMRLNQKRKKSRRPHERNLFSRVDLLPNTMTVGDVLYVSDGDSTCRGIAGSLAKITANPDVTFIHRIRIFIIVLSAGSLAQFFPLLTRCLGRYRAIGR